MRTSVLLIAIVGAASLSACGTQDSNGSSLDDGSRTIGCEKVVPAIKENPEFTPYEHRLTHTPFDDRLALRALADPAAIPADVSVGTPTLDGLPAIAAEVIADDYYTLAYSEHVPADSMSEFMRSGGLILEVTPGEAGDDTSIAQDLFVDSRGDGHIVLVEVGKYEAAVSWADPDQGGVRAHHVLWTDDRGLDVNLYGVRDAETLVGIARTLAC